MARRWPQPVDPQPPAKLLEFDPDDWILGGRGDPARARMALHRWHEARYNWVAVDPNHRMIDDLDVIDLLFANEG